MKQDKNVNENRPTQNRSLSSSSGNRNPLISPRPGCRRNVRELSINTELAARGRPATKITHRAIQPPTPNTLETRQNLSIAEVMNSPLPLGTPTSVSPLHSDQKVSEIMDMFRQAYISSQAITPHPTFETLQDAIVREINSHEAFRRVPVPDPGPPFTPSPSEESFDGVLNVKRSPGSGSNRTVSLKDGQFSKLIRRSSFKKHTRARTSETGKSISTSVPSKAFRRASETTNRRRHTDAPPPTPGFFDTLETRPQRGTVRPEEQVTYMDLLLRSQKSSSNPGPKRYPDLGSHLDHVQRMSTASPDMSERSIPAPSVLHMRAQTSVSSGDSRTSFSAYESDEEVIQLPSVGVPFVQIQCVDEHNLSHVAENATSRNAYRLMNWPRKSNRSISLRGNAIKNGSSPSQPTPRIERWVRGMRSVESY
ncbi:hypothetical protein EYZ11_006733 [Aspergillus tanneri]|nr:hypothetical protein EYZ11_006733 [Aspergillus tanneri]